MSDAVRETWLLWVRKDITVTSVEIISLHFCQNGFSLNSGWHSTDWDMFQSWADRSWLISECVQISVRLTFSLRGTRPQSQTREINWRSTIWLSICRTIRLISGKSKNFGRLSEQFHGLMSHTAAVKSSITRWSELFLISVEEEYFTYSG